ncbi:MAG TPA: hypothetical protein VI670_00330 [Thermoanaerobaculia bacterium]
MRNVLPALLIGIAAGIAAYAMPHPIRLGGVEVGDIGPPLAGMQSFLHGGSPYEIGLRRGTLSNYPFMAMLVVAPLLLVPLWLAAPIFCGVSAALLGYGVLREGKRWRLLLFLSAPFVSSLHSVQWTPLLTAALFIPPLLALFSVKPQVGLALVAAGRWNRVAIVGAAALVLLALLIDPYWPRDWLAHLTPQAYLGRSPLLVVPGFLLAAAALAARAREGRLLLAQAIPPQRYFYDQLPMLLVPRTAAQMVILVAASWIAPAASIALRWWDPSSGAQDLRSWTLYVATFHLSALAMVLWNVRRPAR